MDGVKNLTIAEAVNDGFKDRTTMISFMFDFYGERMLRVPMNKIVLKWIERVHHA